MLIGQEYTVIGWCKNRLILQDKDLLQSLLVDICDGIKMRSLGSIGVDVPVELEKLDEVLFEDEGGSTSGVLAVRVVWDRLAVKPEQASQASLVLSTSHANIHGWPERDTEREDGGFFWFTVGSCRSFDPKTVDEMLTSALHVTDANKSERYISIIDGRFVSETTRAA